MIAVAGTDLSLGPFPLGPPPGAFGHPAVSLSEAMN